MTEALLYGVLASSALVIGGSLGALWNPPNAVLAVALAFASGALISAVSYDLFQESVRSGTLALSGLGLLAGAAVFVVADALLDRYIEGSTSVSGFAILAAVTLDGVPENLALGVSLLQGSGSITLLAAIFASNLPEALCGAVGMRQSGRTRLFAAAAWALAGALLAAAVVAGYAALSGATSGALSLLQSFAAGAVIASLADTLMPDAYRNGGSKVAFATAAGFFASFVLSSF